MNQAGQLEIVVDEVDGVGSGVARVRLTGEVDLANAEELHEAMTAAAVAESGAILLDLRDLEFMDSSGLRIVLMAAQEREDRIATIVSEGSAVANLFEMVDVGERLNVVPSEDEGLRRISGRS